MDIDRYEPLTIRQVFAEPRHTRCSLARMEACRREEQAQKGQIMRNRSTWFIAVSVCAVLVIGAAVPFAFAAPRGKPGVTPPGVPPGQPFQALQKQIDDLNGAVNGLDARVDALEAAQSGLMWINPLSFLAGTSTVALAAGLGLAVTSAAAGTDVVQAGLQVPVGLAVTGSRVCYVPGTAASPSTVSSVQMFQDPVLPDGPAVLVPGGSPTIAAGTAVVCVDTPLPSSPVPSAGGALSLSINLNFTAADTIVIRAVGLQLAPPTP